MSFGCAPAEIEKSFAPPHGEAKNELLQLQWKHAQKLIQPAGIWGDSNPKVWERFAQWFVRNKRKAHGEAPHGEAKNKLLQL